MCVSQWLVCRVCGVTCHADFQQVITILIIAILIAAVLAPSFLLRVAVRQLGLKFVHFPRQNAQLGFEVDLLRLVLSKNTPAVWCGVM